MAEGVLGAIVARKRADVAARLGGVEPREPARAGGADRGAASRAALARPGARFIMEVKRASPSAGALRPGVDPAAQAPRLCRRRRRDQRAHRRALFRRLARRSARRCGAPLTGRSSPRTSSSIRARSSEARLHGADAVLVMLSVLDDDEARGGDRRRRGGSAWTCWSRRMTRARCAARSRSARRSSASTTATCARSRSTSPTTERLAPLVPTDRLVVAESGIADRADVERLAPHADAFLVGSSLMRADDPGEAARALAFGRVKVCGLTNAADLDMAAAAGRQPMPAS